MPIASSFPVDYVAAQCLHSPTEKAFQIQLQSTKHRLTILSEWDIPEGAQVLEIGCGQGDCTAVLAELVGPQGHVTAVDPGSLDYGSPFTLGQAQAHLSAGPLGPRITWKQVDPLLFLQSSPSPSPTETQYDVAILAICIWYFASPGVLAQILEALSTRAKRVCIAEWSLTASTLSAYPHVLAALAQAAVECHNPTSVSNVRTILSPSAIVSSASAAGWTLKNERMFQPAKGTLDGMWEVGAVVDEGYLKEAQRLIQDEKERSVAIALRDAVVASLEAVGGTKGVDSMSVWCGEFVRD